MGGEDHARASRAEPQAQVEGRVMDGKAHLVEPTESEDVAAAQEEAPAATALGSRATRRRSPGPGSSAR